MAKAKPSETTGGEHPDVENQKLLRRIRKLGKAIAEKKSEIEKQEEVVQDAKDKLDSKRAVLNTFNNELSELQDDLDRLASGQFAERLDFESEAQIPAGDSATPASETIVDWRQVRMDSFGLSDAVVASLTAADLMTLGAISDWCKDKPLTDIKGIGQAKGEQIEKAMERFWSEHPNAR